MLVVVAFALGESVGGEEGWWGRLIQLAIGLGLVARAWFAPKVGGPLLIDLGIVPIVFMLANATPGGVIGSTVLIIWLPLILARVFFTRARFAPRRPATAHEGSPAQ
jgi:hypothetical protein